MNGIADTLYGDERVSSFSTYIGDTAPRFILLFDPKAPEDGHGQMIIVATDQKSRDALRQEIMDTVTEKYPDAQAHTRLITTGPPSEYPVMFRLSGESIDETVKLASEALSIMKQNPNVTNASLDWPQETPTLKLKINQDKVRELGIDIYAVSQDLYVKLSGYKVAESYQGDQLIPISFKLEGDNAARLASLDSLPVHVGNGRYVPLGEFADLSYENETSTIWRRDLKPTITLRADVTGGAKADSVSMALYDTDLKAFRAGLPEVVTFEKDGCYKSESNTTNDSAKPFVDRMIQSEHYAMLEHGTVYLVCNHGELPLYTSNKFSRCHTIDGKDYITTNLRVLAENKAMDDLKYLSDYEEGKHELRITVHFTTQIAITREYNRHRANSMAEQSTRYCNYSKNKFDNEITINLPTWVEEEGYNGSQEKEDYRLEDMCADIAEGRAQEWSKLDTWIFANQAAEYAYMKLIEAGCKPQEARAILPLDCNTELVHTAFINDWKHFFDLRALGTTGAPHPDAKVLALPLMEEFKAKGYLK